MSDNNKKIGRGNKRGYSQRNDKDLADVQKSIKLRQSHWEKFERIKSRTNVSFNGFVGNLMENFFQRSVLDEYVTIAADITKLSVADYIAIIGNEVDPSKAMACLVAWLDGASITPCEISPRGSSLYQHVLGRLRGTPAEGYTHSESARMLDYIRQYYFYEKEVHLHIYDLSKVYSMGNGPDKDEWIEYVIDQLNAFIDMEYASLNFSCSFSAHVRFSIYDAWYGQMLRNRAQQPDWSAPVKERVEAMNKPFTGL